MHGNLDMACATSSSSKEQYGLNPDMDLGLGSQYVVSRNTTYFADVCSTEQQGVHA